LEVKPRALEILAASAQKPYDGTPLECHGYTAIIRGRLVEGHYIAEIVCTGKITEVGTCVNEIYKIVIEDENGVDVTDNYDIRKLPGSLTVLDDD
jgi:hypothetical protein